MTIQTRNPAPPKAIPKAGFIPQVWGAFPFAAVSVERTRIYGVVPPEGNGLVCRGMDLFFATESAASNADYWVVEMGTMSGQMEFSPKATAAQPFTGWAKGRNAVDFQVKIRYANGDIIAVRVRPVGDPAALTTLDVVPRLQES